MYTNRLGESETTRYIPVTIRNSSVPRYSPRMMRSSSEESVQNTGRMICMCLDCRCSKRTWGSCTWDTSSSPDHIQPYRLHRWTSCCLQRNSLQYLHHLHHTLLHHQARNMEHGIRAEGGRGGRRTGTASRGLRRGCSTYCHGIEYEKDWILYFQYIKSVRCTGIARVEFYCIFDPRLLKSYLVPRKIPSFSTPPLPVRALWASPWPHANA